MFQSKERKKKGRKGVIVFKKCRHYTNDEKGRLWNTPHFFCLLLLTIGYSLKKKLLLLLLCRRIDFTFFWLLTRGSGESKECEHLKRRDGPHKQVAAACASYCCTVRVCVRFNIVTKSVSKQKSAKIKIQKLTFLASIFSMGTKNKEERKETSPFLLVDTFLQSVGSRLLLVWG